MAGLLCALGALWIASPGTADAACPPIENKPGATPHVQYEGVRHLTFCQPVTVQPGQNIIRLNGSDLFPRQPGYITRFDPELVYSDGTGVPRVDVVHLHHAVWIVNGNPQFAAGEEKTIIQAPRGFGWRSDPSDNWLLNDMLHDLVGTPANLNIVWRVDFVPDTAVDCTPPIAPGTDCIRRVRTRWMDVSGPSPRVGTSSSIYPVFNALRRMGQNGRYTFPDQATGAQRDLIGPSQSWTPNHPVTLITTAGHLHPGGLSTDLRVRRGNTVKRLFRSGARYFEPAGAVSWDVSMGATPPGWRVKLQAGDRLSVAATYDVGRADWYEVMGIMPVAVYDGVGVGGKDALSNEIPQQGVLTHGHLDENRNHGGDPMGLPDPRTLPGDPTPPNPIGIDQYAYEQGDMYAAGSFRNPPTVPTGQSLIFRNLDDPPSGPSPNVFHTITGCKAPCNRSPGIAYPIADGPVTFDSGQLGFNSSFNAPAADRDTWSTPRNLNPGTYAYFCRVHPFMRGSFRVVNG